MNINDSLELSIALDQKLMLIVKQSQLIRRRRIALREENLG